MPSSLTSRDIPAHPPSLFLVEPHALVACGWAGASTSSHGIGEDHGRGTLVPPNSVPLSPQEAVLGCFAQPPTFRILQVTLRRLQPLPPKVQAMLGQASQEQSPYIRH